MPDTTTMLDLNELPVHMLLPRLQAREVSARDLAEACIARTEAHEAEIGAWTTFDAAAVRAQADELDAGPLRGLLHGIPVAVKDIIDTADLPTQCGTPIYAGRTPEQDADCVARTRAAGGLVMGKSVTTEFACVGPGKTVNPHSLHAKEVHTPGGSSSGTAAAVAACMVPLGFGTQTAGSVIRPAAFCGVVGFKPTFGVHSLAGVQPLGPTLDTLGWLCRAVEDAEIMRAAQLGEAYKPLDADGPYRIGYCETPDWHSARGAAARAMDTARTAMERAGAKVVPFDLTPPLTHLVEDHKLMMAYEVNRSLADEYRDHADLMTDGLRALIEEGETVSDAAYKKALKAAEAARQEIARLFDEAGIDAILTPSARGEAPEGLSTTGDPVFNRLWTLLKLPCAAVPVLDGPAGLPVGVQLVGKLNRDRELLTVAKFTEQAFC